MPEVAEEVREVPVDKIVSSRFQPRRQFDQAAIEELAASIKEHGLLQPIIVRPLEDDEEGMYELLAGERRWRAHKHLGLLSIRATVRQVSDDEARQITLVENIQREDLTVIEESRMLNELLGLYGGDAKKLAEAISKRAEYIGERVELLTLPEVVQEHLDAGRLTLAHAKVLLELESLSDRVAAADRAVKYRMSPQELRGALQRQLSRRQRKQPTVGLGQRPMTQARLSSLLVALFDALEGFDFSALQDPNKRQTVKKQLGLVREQLGEALAQLEDEPRVPGQGVVEGEGGDPQG